MTRGKKKKKKEGELCENEVNQKGERETEGNREVEKRERGRPKCKGSSFFHLRGSF